uniref:U-box domain-containing protein 52-like n=1 Tax=Fragaria vesca subsp. vesca TaxID=101020 RepID=UPI0005C96B04|nr:PREDICTED: U-box domain-containing protein 52-like [Fragaria vesca subsp. vesca]
MGLRKLASQKRGDAVAVAVDKDKGSQYAFRWVVNHLVKPGQTLTLLHVKQPAPRVPNQRRMALGSEVSEEVAKMYKNQPDAQAKEWLLSMRCICIKKKINCNEVILEDSDISKALINYVAANSIEVLVLGITSKSGIFRFRTRDVPSTVLKGAPDFCTVYVISREKISSVRSATGALPQKPEGLPYPCTQNEQHHWSEMTQYPQCSLPNDNDQLESANIAARSSKKQSLGRTFAFSDNMAGPRLSNSSEFDRSSISTSYSGTTSYSGATTYSGTEFIDMTYQQNEFSFTSMESERSSNIDGMEAELRRLQLELKQTMDMYSLACKEAVKEKNKAKELNQWKLEKEHQLKEALLAEEMALKLAEKEKEKCRAAIKEAEAAQRVAKLEAQKARIAEMQDLNQADEGREVSESMTYDLRYRKYTIEELEAATNDFSQANKIGEGSYGPVYVGEIDHTRVAIKVLRPDAAQGRLQFQRESDILLKVYQSEGSKLYLQVEILSCIRHPNMVLLLGACPEYGCLVYEYMANGSLEDCLFQRCNTQVIPWQLRFKIAAEICTGLYFLHQNKPEPLVHRDLKPGNILLDHNYVSKISDVGLGRLVPQSVADSVTQYRMTSTAGTFCYIDPEYQQTGMLATKSDVYSLGVMLLQLITAKPPMGLTHHVMEAIEIGNFAQILDPAVPDWPVEEALKFAKLGLQCAEMRRKDRPDLGKVVLPELNRLSALAEESMHGVMHSSSRAGRVILPKQVLRASLTIQVSSRT